MPRQMPRRSLCLSWRRLACDSKRSLGTSSIGPRAKGCWNKGSAWNGRDAATATATATATLGTLGAATPARPSKFCPGSGCAPAAALQPSEGLGKGPPLALGKGQAPAAALQPSEGLGQGPPLALGKGQGGPSEPPPKAAAACAAAWGGRSATWARLGRGPQPAARRARPAALGAAAKSQKWLRKGSWDGSGVPAGV